MAIKISIFHIIWSFQAAIHAHEVVDHVPIAMEYNPGPYYSLLNSVDYHPRQNLFCIASTNNHEILIYKINAAEGFEMVQVLANPAARLSCPQHAVFSPDGEKIVVANWCNQSLTVYRKDEGGSFQETPAAEILKPESLKISHKPHGIAFSPCGNYLAIAYGAADYHEKALGLFSVTQEGLCYELLQLVEGENVLPGIPKGIAFTPDGTSLLVTYADANAVGIYALSENPKAIEITPRQMIQGEESGLSRPEDIKLTPDGCHCAVSNSSEDSISFFPFDPSNNLITQNKPCLVMRNPEASLHFPHGIAFSTDGAYMLVTEFGRIHTTLEGNVVWDSSTKIEESKVNLYKMTQNPCLSH